MDFQYYLDLTTHFVKFKSISTDPAFQSEIHSTVNWLKELFDTNNFTTELWLGEKTNPVVFASIVVNPVFETILVYGHYDVQPAEQTDGWDTDPFNLIQKRRQVICKRCCR